MSETHEQFFVRMTGRDVATLASLNGPDDWEALAGILAAEGNREGAAYASGISMYMRTVEGLADQGPPEVQA